MATSEHVIRPTLCFCDKGVNRCHVDNLHWILDVNANVNESARTWNVTATIRMTKDTGWYELTIRDITLNGVVQGTKYAGRVTPTGYTYLSKVIASGSYDNNGTPNQSSVTATSSGWFMPWSDACQQISSGRRWNMNTSATVSIPRIAALNRPPSITSAQLTSSNPNVYQLNAGISGIDWGMNYSNPTLRCNISYNLDGVNYNWTAGTWTGSNTSRSFSVDGMTLVPSAPWTRIPDDATVTISWTASTSVGSSTVSKTQYCMSQYEAFVITPGNVIPADLFASTISAAPNPNLPIRRISSIKA